VPGWFDAAQVQQALINLLKNAHESGGPPQEVKLAVDALGDGGVRFRVLDRGSGMTDEVMRQALLPFYSSKPGGSGLGLPLCREIVEAHGGRLRIERRPGGGTAVICWLPGSRASA
jgi:signal transduction histidine kinase